MFYDSILRKDWPMPKRSKDAKVELEGVAALMEAGNLSIKTYPATVSITTAMSSAGVDTGPMLAAIMKLSSHEQKALEDKSMTINELQVPRPDGYTDERAASLASSFASSIRSDRQTKWTKWLAVAAMGATVIAAVL
ncbi:MAG: hypothetical protein U5K76_12735 [Woeseiaceae bacterium]|nr:hypothetical protein [Woeseiaceae bacterium]